MVQSQSKNSTEVGLHGGKHLLREPDTHQSESPPQLSLARLTLEGGTS